MLYLASVAPSVALGFLGFSNEDWGALALAIGSTIITWFLKRRGDVPKP